MKILLSRVQVCRSAFTLLMILFAGSVFAAEAPRFLVRDGIQVPGAKRLHRYKGGASLISGVRLEGLPKEIRDQLTPVESSEFVNYRAWSGPASVLKNGGDEYFIVALDAPVDGNWRTLLESFGVTIVDVAPPFGFVVRANGSALTLRLKEVLTTEGLEVIRGFFPLPEEAKIAEELKLVLSGLRTLESLGGRMSSDGRAVVRVDIHSDRNKAEVLDAIAEIAPRAGVLGYGHAETFLITTADLPKILAVPGVAFVAPVYHQAKWNNLAPKATSGSAGNPPIMNATPLWAAPYNLTGAGVIVNLNDGGVDTDHADLQFPSTVPDCRGAQGAAGTDNWHGTHTAGSIVGRGLAATQPSAHPGDLSTPLTPVRGIAYGATLVSNNIFDTAQGAPCSGASFTTESTMMKWAQDKGAALSSNSWGYTGGAPFFLPVTTYGAEAADIDRAVRDADTTEAGNQALLILFAAGNNGSGTNTVSTPGLAKNVITVGATENDRNGCFVTSGANVNDIVGFSSRGPSRGLIKPDVVAPGADVLSVASADPGTGGCDSAWTGPNYRLESGTSMATPLAAGASTLFIQWWKSNHAGTNPKPALVKAAIINGAFNAGLGYQTNTPTGTAAQNSHGWGRFDLLRSIAGPATGAIRFVDPSTVTPLATGGSWTQDLCVTSSTTPLKVTLHWTDAPGVAGCAAGACDVNNLDLRVRDSGVDLTFGTADDVVYRGNQFTSNWSDPALAGTDVNNVVENVFVQAPSGRPWRIEVNATNVAQAANDTGAAAAQDFAVVYSGAIADSCCTPPSAPTTVTAAVNGVNSLKVDWNAVGGVTSYQVYRKDAACAAAGTFSLLATVTGGAITYTDTTVTAPNTYSYKIVSVGTCNSAQSTACGEATAVSCVNPGAPATLTVTAPASPNQLDLSWTASATSGVTYKIYRYAGASCGGGATVVASGLAGLTYSDTGLPAGAYSYRVAAVDGTCETLNGNGCQTATATGGPLLYAAGRFASGRPEDTAGTTPTRWVYASSASSMVPPAITTTGVYAPSNDRVMHAMNTGTAAGGGAWPRTAPMDWKPPTMNAPSQNRANVVDLSATGNPYAVNYTVGVTNFTTNRILYAGSQDGYVYLIDANNGRQIWSSPKLGDMIQSTPIGFFRKSGSGLNKDLILVGSRSTTMVNKFYALNVANGQIVWEFDNGGTAVASLEMGIINGGARTNYATKQLFFASRRKTGGTSETLFCLNFGDTAAPPVKVWSAAIGDVDGLPIRHNGKILVGNNGGRVYAFNEVNTGTAPPLWSFDTNDGPVKSFIMQSFTAPTDMLYLATTNTVWGLQDGVTPTLRWSVPINAPSTPMFTGTHLLLGSGDGKLYQFTSGYAAPTVKSVPLGAGTAGVGSPNFYNNVAYAGTEAGTVFAVATPLP